MKMNNSQLIIIISSITLLFILCVLYLIANRGNDKVIELSLKSLLVPVVIAFVLFVFEYYKPLEITNNKMLFSITENPSILNRLVTHQDGISTLVNQATMETTVFYNKNKEKLSFSSDKNKIEIAELILLHLIHKRYSDHWQIDFQQSEPFFEMSSSMTGKKANATKKIYTLDEKTLHKIYPKDHLIQKIDSEIKFSIPEKTQFTVSGDDHKRTICFKNKYISTEINIEKLSNATLPHNGGKTAALIRKKLNLPLDESYSLDFYAYILKMKVIPNRLLKWNPNTIEQTEWFKELFEYLESTYGWNTIVKQLEENNYN